MPTAVIMPALGMAQDTGTLLQWLRSEGEEVQEGEPLMEIATDKVDVNVDAPASGVLAQIRAAPGDVIPVGETIALIFAPGEEVDTSVGEPSASPVARRMAQAHDLDLTQIEAGGARIGKADVLSHLAAQEKSETESPRLQAASPLARRMASERGMDLADIRGSGPEGAVLAADVPQVRAAPSASDAQESKPKTSDAAKRMWQRAAERLSQSWIQSPHFYLQRDVKCARLIEWYQSASSRIDGLSYTDLLLFAIARAIPQHPRVASRWRNGDIEESNEIGLGLAVSVSDGLMVPVIPDADRLTLAQLSEHRRDLVLRTREGRLTAEDLTDGVFTLSNLGMYDVDAFNAIINPPQAAILAVGRIADRVVAVDGRPAVAPMMTLTLSCDHRVLDGAMAALFLETLIAHLESPLSLLE